MILAILVFHLKMYIIEIFDLAHRDTNRERSIFVRFTKLIHQIVPKSIGYFRKIFLKILGGVKGRFIPPKPPFFMKNGILGGLTPQKWVILTSNH